MAIVGAFHHVHMISRDPDGVADWFERFFGSEIVAEQFPAGARNLVLRVGELYYSLALKSFPLRNDPEAE